MRFLLNARQWLLTLLCVTLVVARVDGAHLHLCLDGQEQSTSVRVAPDVPAPDGAKAPHNDVDLALGADALTKTSKGELKQAAAPPPAFPTFTPPAVSSAAPAAAIAASSSTPSLVLPPLRGPPSSVTA
jgi:hypothetical protein